MANAAELLAQADRLEEEARHNEELAEAAITDTARRRLSWEANKLHGEAARRYMDAQRMLRPLDFIEEPMVFEVGGLKVTQADIDAEYGDFEIPDRIKALLAEDNASEWV